MKSSGVCVVSCTAFRGSDRFTAIVLIRQHQAYLMLGKSKAATVEFQKIVDHPGLVLENPVGALARLGLARAYAMQGDTAKSRAAYQDFLTLWKDADPDIPIFKQAKAEYAKLQQ
jgi:predicted Zn-dependent protease